ncbi:MAG: thrombospondin type 3 repeat-containing protein [Bacteroidia bacterium]|nr:thrombospondin type 3 repeat-containing protein [Bacteroidia bacterium]
MIKKNSLTIVLLLTIVGLINSQNEKGKKAKQLPSIAIGAGVLSFDGDIGNGVNLSSLSRIRGGYNLTVEQRIGKVVGVSFNGIYGKLADSESSLKRNINFEAKIIQADLNLVLHLDNDFIFKRSSVFAPYLFVGFGYMKFDSYSDLTDKNGIKYNYWTDGTIRDLKDSTIGAKIIQRDYTYESKLNDSAKYANSTFALPIGLGVNLKVVDNLYINLGATYYMTMSDWIDNFKSGKNDSYIFANVAVQYNFGKPYDDSNPVYETVDFSSLDNLDSDEDGVKDGNDVCPGTPKGAKITPNGCPEDSDEDGVSDYMDKEPLTKKGAFVDESGVTITEKMIAERQTVYSALATERSNLFNENPSLKYLKEVEAKSKKGARKSGTIPLALKVADANNDNFISTDEISKAIDSFFEGDSDFTVEKLNDLIDFFFDQ